MHIFIYKYLREKVNIAIDDESHIHTGWGRYTNVYIHTSIMCIYISLSCLYINLVIYVSIGMYIYAEYTYIFV